jgi:hypothetical protein
MCPFKNWKSEDGRALGESNYLVEEDMRIALILQTFII